MIFRLLKLYFTLIVTLLFVNRLIAQPKKAERVVEVRQDDISVNVIEATYYWLDNGNYLQISQILNGAFQKIKGTTINFGSTNARLWLRFQLKNPSGKSRHLAFVTKGLDSLQLFQVDSLNRIKASAITGTHISMKSREIASSYLLSSFYLPANSTQTIYLRMSNSGYELSVSPYLILDYEEARLYIKRREIIHNAYLGGLILLLFFGGALLVFFKERLYSYYLACVMMSILMMFFYHDYYYLFIEKAPQIIRNKNIFGIITSTVPIFYLLFSREYLVFGYDKRGLLKVIIKYTIFATILVVTTFIVFELNFFKYRQILYIFIFSLCGLTMTLLFRSLVRKYKPAWLFLFATTPVLFIGFIESLSDFHNFPIQDIHSYYYTATLVEMYLLTLGLAFKFKLSKDEKEKLQIEVYAIETQAQERERQRIAQDIHDSIGGFLSALRLKLSTLLKNHRVKESDITPFEDTLAMLDQTAETVRTISHSLAPSTLTKLGLIPALFELYQHVEQPKFVIHQNGFNERIDLSKEMALYYIIQECVTNIRKHAEAKEVSIQFNKIKDRLSINIEDDGKGFDINEIALRGKGLENINFRVKEHLRGEIIIDSSPGNGTIILIKMRV